MYERTSRLLHCLHPKLPLSRACALALVLALGTLPILGALKYQKPPKEVLDVLNAPNPPAFSVSPTGDRALMVDSLRYPPIADLAQPMLRLAGLRINPKTNGRHRVPHGVGLTLKGIPDGKEIKVTVPANAYLSSPEWSSDGKQFAFYNMTGAGIELWVGNAATGATRKIPGISLNAAYGDALDWMPDGRTLICLAVVANRGPAPAEPQVPEGPNVQESFGRQSPTPTYEDLLQNPHDEDLFEYYASSQLTLVDTAGGKLTAIGKAGIHADVTPSPDGQHLLVVTNHKPYSYLLPAGSFPKEVEVWDRTGKVEYRLASLPLADQVPLDGVPTGPRSYNWRANEPATLVWVEALDGGNSRRPAPVRDKVMLFKAPFSGKPTELAKTEQRFAGIEFGEKGGWAFLRDFDRNRRWNRTFLINTDNPGEAPKLVWDLSSQDRYKNPGSPVTRGAVAGGRGGGFGRGGAVNPRPIRQSGDTILLTGAGASPKGDRPFLDRFNLKTLKSERIFQGEDKTYESVVAVLSDDGSRFITRYESTTEPPNYFVRTAGGSSKQALTVFPDPAPQLAGIKKQLVTYKRPDGVPLSFTLYLPPGYQEGQRLPTVVWAYPREYGDAYTGGQVSGSEYRFTTIGGTSHLFFLLEGYAVLDGATMPVIGDPETMNDTYIEQIVASAKAAIDKAAEMGVTDPDRVGVGGHSYGSFMTANLLAHSRLFRAGIAESGAHNRTLTPFGFQSERRTLWEAPQTYLRMSPFMYADKLKDPILLVHGEIDDNSGTFPIQSERMYQAIRGNGGNVRYVTLPYEAHGYAARETIEHVLWEEINWFNKYVKNAQPRSTTTSDRK